MGIFQPSYGYRVCCRTVAILLLWGVSASAQALDWVYTVRPGENMAAVAKRFLASKYDAHALYQHNKLRPSRALKAGAKLRIPIAWLKLRPARAQLLHSRGDVKIIQAAGDDVLPRASDTELQVGDEVVTGADGSALIEFADGSQLRVQQNSRLIFDTLSVFGETGMVDTRMRLPAGRIEGQVTPNGATPSRFEITTPAAVAAVRGTDLRVGAEADRPGTRNEVLSGEVRVQVGGKTVDLARGLGLAAVPGQPPPRPRPLLPAPVMAGPADYIEHLPLRFQWRPQAGAEGFRVQLLRGDAQGSLVTDVVQNQRTYRWPALADGTYILRVRAIDEAGLEGFHAEHAFLINAEPPAPRLQAPVPGRRVGSLQPSLRWSAAAKATGYVLQLARDAQFKQDLQSLRLPKTESYKPTQDLARGEYFWRVAGLDDQGERGPYSQAARFEVRPRLAVPVFEGIEVAAEYVEIRWRPVDGAQTYELRVKGVDEFNDYSSVHVTEATRLRLPRPGTGEYICRVRALDTSGEAGRFSTAEPMNVYSEEYWRLFIMTLPALL